MMMMIIPVPIRVPVLKINAVPVPIFFSVPTVRAYWKYGSGSYL